ncbi:NTP transferase domain-containing protein [Antrihabitans stalactiti]|uniref:NTP transferase domain-containing protein n=1 Tax=Antrihabitans stalactiti TaxID=2584121 RepID=UPI0030B85941
MSASERSDEGRPRVVGPQTRPSEARADSIVLAGGRGSRMGGVDKPAIEIGGVSMLATALAAVAGCERRVVVGPHRPDLPAEVVQTQEDPRGSGPVSAIAAGLRELRTDAPLVVILAADMPFLRRDAIEALVTRSAESGADAVHAIDDEGRPQYLVGVWRKKFLLDRLAAIGSPVNLPMKSLVPDHSETVRLEGISDCDTDEDVARAVASLGPPPALDLDGTRSTIRNGLSRLPVRRLPLHDALGAVLAAPVHATQPLPRFDVSAMDGYAVAGDGPWVLRAAVGYAGGTRPARLEIGEAVRIATGAHLPEGSSSVLRDEFATVDGDRLSRLPDTPVRADVRRVGEEWQPGHVLAQAGSTVTPMTVSAAASGEVTEADVRGPVRAHVVVTGDEIRRDGPLREGQTRDSVGPVLPLFLAWCGIRVASDAHLRDTANAFDDLLAAAPDAELIVIVGATGRGAADQLRTALARANARLLVERARCRPGGSQITAELPDGRVVLGLPGNPFAAISTLLISAPAILDGLTDRAPREPFVGPVINADELSGPVTRIVPVRRIEGGKWEGDSSTRTAHLAGLVGRDALALVPPNARALDLVELILLPNQM